jgi:hypothetical protein
VAVFTAGVTQAYVTNNAQAKLAALRRALNDLHDFQLWLSAYATADLVALGFTSADAQDIFNAIADANALYQIFATGQPPGTYPQAASAYVYSASQRIVTGPLS